MLGLSEVALGLRVTGRTGLLGVEVQISEPALGSLGYTLGGGWGMCHPQNCCCSTTWDRRWVLILGDALGAPPLSTGSPVPSVKLRAPPSCLSFEMTACFYPVLRNLSGSLEAARRKATHRALKDRRCSSWFWRLQVCSSFTDGHLLAVSLPTAA